MLLRRSHVLRKKMYLNGNTLNFLFHMNKIIINNAPINDIDAEIIVVITIILISYSFS